MWRLVFFMVEKSSLFSVSQESYPKQTTRGERTAVAVVVQALAHNLESRALSKCGQQSEFQNSQDCYTEKQCLEKQNKNEKKKTKKDSHKVRQSFA